MNKDLLINYINFTKEDYIKKLETLDRTIDMDKCYMLSGAVTYMDMILANIESGRFDKTNYKINYTRRLDMKVITTRLRRYKITKIILNILVFPIRFPIFLIYWLEDLRPFEKLLYFIDNILLSTLECISIKFKFEEQAFKQKELNPSKFKDLY